MRALTKLLALAAVLALGVASRLLPVRDEAPASMAVPAEPATTASVPERDALESR